MNTSVQHTALPAHTPGLPQSPESGWNPQAEADRILEVGDRRFRTDDYAARADAFAETLDGLDVQQREALMAAVLDEDPNALNSWLNPGELGGLDARGRALIGEALAGAYNNGHPALQTFEVPANPGNIGSSDTRQQSPLDGAVLSHSAYSTGSGLETAQQARDFVELMSASSGPEASQFRADYADHLIEQYVLNEGVDPVTRDAAAGIAAQMLGNDTTRPNLVIDALTGLSAADRATFLNHVERSSGLFGNDIVTGLANNDARQPDPADIRLQDGLGLLMSAVARSADPAAAGLAVEFAGLPAANGDWFGRQDAGERNTALSQLFLSHSDAILDAMSVYESASTGNAADPGERAYNANVDALGALLGEILFNPDASLGGVVQSTVLEYSGALTAEINASAGRENSAGFEEASGRLVVLRAATGEAIAQQYDAITASREATAQAVGFLVDLTLAALPASLRAGDVVKNALADALPEGAVREAVQGLTGQIVSETTGRLTTEAKSQLADALGEDYADVVEQSQLQQAIEEQMLAGVEDERDRAGIRRDSDGISGDR